MKNEIRKISGSIGEHIRKVKTAGIKGDILGDIFPSLFKIITFYTPAAEFDIDELHYAHKELGVKFSGDYPKQTDNSGAIIELPKN